MKKIIVMTCLGFATAFSSIAQDNSKAAERANRLSDQMIRDLRLNNFQANRLRAINQQKVNQMMQIESQYASNPDLVDKNCKGVCKQRDKEVEAFLSADQYSRYFSARTQYYKADKTFASSIGAITPAQSKSTLPLGKEVPVSKKTTTTISQDDSK